MYRFVKKKEKSVVFSLRLSTKKPPTLFFQPRPTLPIIPTPPLLLIIIAMSNPLLSQPLLLFGTRE